MEKITIICEKNEKTNLLENVSFELISKAKRLIQKADEILGFASEMIVEAVCFGLNLDDKEKEKLYSSGADKIVLIKDETLEDFCLLVLGNTDAGVLDKEAYSIQCGEMITD